MIIKCIDPATVIELTGTNIEIREEAFSKISIPLKFVHFDEASFDDAGCLIMKKYDPEMNRRYAIEFTKNETLAISKLFSELMIV